MEYPGFVLIVRGIQIAEARLGRAMGFAVESPECRARR